MEEKSELCCIPEAEAARSSCTAAVQSVDCSYHCCFLLPHDTSQLRSQSPQNKHHMLIRLPIYSSISLVYQASGWGRRTQTDRDREDLAFVFSVWAFITFIPTCGGLRVEDLLKFLCSAVMFTIILRN